MTTKEFFGKIFSRYLLLHFLAMAVFVVLVGLGVKFGLEYYTHHGEGIEVPLVKGQTYNKAHQVLDELGLVIMVSDSGYNKEFPADYILAQSPNQGMKVKRGHVIYVTVNSPSSPTFAIPDIVDNSSVREAEAKLMAMGFRLLPPQQIPGEKDWVYGILCRGRRVSNGDRIPIEHPLTLLVGSGTVSESDEFEYVDATSSNTGIGDDEIDEFEEVKEPPVGEENVR